MLIAFQTSAGHHAIIRSEDIIQVNDSDSTNGSVTVRWAHGSLGDQVVLPASVTWDQVVAKLGAVSFDALT
jgi:hypothetical protein